MKNTFQKIHIGLIGLGVVGSGVARMLVAKRRMLREKTGFDFRLKTICVRNIKKKRPIRPKGIKITANIKDLLTDPQIDQVVELMGGIHPAHAYIGRALQNGKDVVSANKALFAEKGYSLYRLSQKTRRHIGLEASVGGGAPIIKALKEGLAANRIMHFSGILNGTCNAILSDMSLGNKSFQDALSDAQNKGYAESDPTLDINGTDTAHKLAILARIAFQREIPFKNIQASGIDKISPLDIEFASGMGYTLKLMAIAKRHADCFELRVHPTLLPKTHLLAAVNGADNAVLFSGDEVGDVLIFGKGAGQKPTASAVLGDIIDLAKLRRQGADPCRVRFCRAKILQSQDIRSRFYLRIHLRDLKGAMGSLTRVLGSNNISISSVHQMETGHGRTVPVILLTHRTTQRQLSAAVAKMNRSPFVSKKIVVLHVED